MKDNDKMKGYDKMNNLYTSRYYAKKNATNGKVTVKVAGGYTNMDAREYQIWKAQK